MLKHSTVLEALKCESLKTLFNGKFEIIPYNTFGAKVRYHCDDGYRLVGLAERVCQGDGYWNGDAPTCQQDLSISSTYKYEGPVLAYYITLYFFYCICSE